MTSTNWLCAGIVLAGMSAIGAGHAALTFAGRTVARPGQAQEGQFRVVRVEAGSKGEQHGDDFVVSDSRTTFRYPADKQIVVSFEWEGPEGKHHFKATWRSPDGKVESVEDFDREATETDLRAHFSLALSDSIVPGMWTIETQIDGQSAGVKTFQIHVDEEALQANRPASDEILRRVRGSMVFVESLDGAGNRLNRGSGFFINPNLVVTAFVNIDGASTLNVNLPGGARVKVTEVAGWNRSLDWALLHVNAKDADPLEAAKPESWGIGDVDYLIDAPHEGGRAIRPVQITGILRLRRGGERIHLSWAGSVDAIGSPLLNSHGKVIGMLSGESLSISNIDSSGAPAEVLPPPNGITPAVGGTSLVVVPITAVAPMPPTGSPATLAEMATRGLFVAPVARDSEIVSATICGSYKKGPIQNLIPEDIRNEFSRKDGNMAVVVQWLPTTNQKTTEELRIYDSEDRLLGGGKPQPINLKPDQDLYSGWLNSIGGLVPGVYRVDVLAGDKVEWRGYFSVRE